MKAEDTLWAGLRDAHAGLSMGLTAENLAEQYDITREQCDAYALRSQEQWARAQAEGIFRREIAPVQVKGRKGTEEVDTDEHPRNTTSESLARLTPVFKPDGRVTAGSASGICDGAASLVVASEAACREHNMAPLARVVAWARVGCEPTCMGIGPVSAIESVLRVSGLTMDDIDMVEINEAFAAQYLACETALSLNRDIVNVNGGAIALGHPLAASGARILTHLTHELRRTGKRYGIGAACIGGGQGIAVLIENVKDW